METPQSRQTIPKYQSVDNFKFFIKKKCVYQVLKVALKTVNWYKGSISEEIEEICMSRELSSKAQWLRLEWL